MAQRAQTPHRPGAVKVEGGKKKGGAGWLKWLLALLLLAAIIIAVILLLAGGDDKDAKSAAGTPTPAPTTAATATPDTSSAATAKAGTLTAGGETLAPGDGAAITAAVGDRAVGTGLEVVSVARGRGFWVGSSMTDRTFIEYGSAVGTTEQQTYKATVGDIVDFRGPVRPAPKNPGRTLKLKPADAKQLTRDGAYINATTVTAR